MRVALISRVDAAVAGFAAMLDALGHEPVGVLTTAQEGDRYGDETLGALAMRAATGLDVLIAGSPSRFAPLLAALEADLAISVAFPLLIPPDALNVPPFGVVNTHPALLPRYRGPNPIAWTVRNGDPELGYTIHRMDAEFDTGAILAQGSAPIEDVERPDQMFARMFELVGSLFPAALARVEAGDPGDPQPADGASYAGFFEPEYAEIDWSRPAIEVHRQVLAWRVAAIRRDAHGALTTINGSRVRVLLTRLDDAEGGARMECADGPLWVVETEPAA
jgi:methionyl-tRNA formyltransferase